MKMPMLLAGAVGFGVMLLVAQQRPAGPYTQDQAAKGRAVYDTNCVGCHAADLGGREGPPLAGSSFMTQWGDRTAGELIRYLQSTMPPGAAALPAESYASV